MTAYYTSDTTAFRSSLPALRRGDASGTSRNGSAGVNPFRLAASAGALKMDGFSWAEIGGRFAGGAVVLAAVGRSLAWLLNWQGARDERKAARMREWEDSLIRREKDYREQIEREITELRGEVAEAKRNMQRVCRIGTQVAQKLRQHSPDEDVLRMWDLALRTAFPLEDEEDDLSALAREVDEARRR